MTRFDRYLLRETVSPLLFSLVLYSTLAVVSMTLPRLQWVVGAPARGLVYWLLLQFPAALVQTLPLALLLAVLLVFGRLASSSELSRPKRAAFRCCASARRSWCSARCSPWPL